MYKIETLKRKNSRKYTPVIELENDDDVIKYLKDNNIYATGTPYFFTHINLSNGDIITQNIQGLVCSPRRLAKQLNLNA